MKMSIPMSISARFLNRLGLSIWLPLPASEAQFKAALNKIYSYRNVYTVTGYASTIPGLTADMLAGAPLSLVNYLAARLEKLDEWGLDKLAALMESDMRPQTAEELISYLQKEDCYLFLPDIFTVEELGRYYLYESGLAEMPKRWKDAIGLVVFGMNAADLENGAFTSRGYIARLCDKKRKKEITVESVPVRYRLPEPGGAFAFDQTEGAEQ